MDLAGVILDIYDDSKGLVLRRKLGSGHPLPEKLASSTLLTHEELAQLPDRLFAMVVENHGETVRKYAMHDEAHLITSMIYFDECRSLLPEDVRQKVAENLIMGCEWYDVRPPASIIKTAWVGAAISAATGVMGAVDAVKGARDAGMAESARGRERMDVLRANQASGAKVAAGRQVSLTDAQSAAMQKGEGPESGYIFGPLSQFSDHAKTHRKLDHQLERGEMIENGSKKADTNGTEAMSHQTARTLNVSRTPQSKVESKTSSRQWQHAGDISRQGPPVHTKIASASVFALPHVQRYPIDTPAQVKQAAAYLDEHLYGFSPIERRLFSTSLLHRAEDLGVKVAGVALEYGGEGYGPHIEPELHARIAGFAGTGHDAVYEVMLEGLGEVSPAVMAEMLKQADAETGADRSYGRPGTGFRDPYAAVYGQPKLAEAMPAKEDVFSWTSGGDYVNGQMLKALASRKSDLDHAFGDGFSQSFAKDPISIFESMPDPQKVVLSRLASDNSSQTFRI